MKKRMSLCIAAAMAMLAMDAVANIQLDKQGGSGGTDSVSASLPPHIDIPTRRSYTFTGYYRPFYEIGVLGSPRGWKCYYDEKGNRRMEIGSSWPSGVMGPGLEYGPKDVLYAQWKLDECTITFNKNGGSGGTSSVKAIFEMEMPSITVPTRTGYTFDGYVNGSICYYLASGASARSWDRKAETATLFAKWFPCKYWVDLDQQGGSGGTSGVTAYYDQDMPSISVPSRSGYTFGGYFSLPGGNGVQYYNELGESVHPWNRAWSTTLYAMWGYKVTLDEQGGNGGTTSVVAAYDGEMPGIRVPKRSGCVFGGYWSDKNGSGTQYYKASGASAHTWDKKSAATLYAHWGCVVTFDQQGGDGGITNIVFYGSAMPSVEVPKRTGYTFCGYWDGKNGAGTQYYTDSGESVRAWDKACGVTLYAKWQVNKYTVTFDANGGTGGGMRVTQDYGTALSAPTVTREHSIFIGWEPDFTGAVPAADTVYVAQWRYYLETAENGDGTISIKGVNFWPDGMLQDGALIIPTNIHGRAVKSIGDYAFRACSNLRSVTIPNSVTSIGLGAFSGCSGIEEIVLPFVGSCRGNSLSIQAHFGYIFGESSYSGGKLIRQSYCTNDSKEYYIPSKLRRVVVTDETILGWGAFQGCSNLASVVLPHGVTQIGQSAFSDCESLVSIRIPNSVKRIESSAFRCCKKLAAVLISDGVTEIGDCAFWNCSGLTNVTIGCSVAKIGDEAFYACTKIESVIIPDSVKEIGRYAFFYCNRPTSVSIPDSVERIGYGAFRCGGLEEITLPFVGECRGGTGYRQTFGYIFGSVIGDDIISVEQQYSPSSYDVWSFSIPSKLKKVVITDETEIGYGAFRNCSMLTDVTIPNTVTKVGYYAFKGCTGLTAVRVSDLAKWCAISFADIYSNPLHCTPNLYLNGVLLEGDLTIPDGVTSIASGAFFGNCLLTSVTIPDGVTRIGADAFYNCSGLVSMTIPDSVTSIGESAFLGCDSLSAIFVSPDDIGRVKSLLAASGSYDFSGINFIKSAHVSFDGSGGEVGAASRRRVIVGCALGELPEPTRKGYAFAGWWTSANGGTQLSAATIVNGDTICYAHWSANTYTVTLCANGGDGGASTVTVAYDSAMPSIAIPSLSGYAFSGYWTNPDGSGVRYYSDSGVSAHKWDIARPATLYAKWMPICVVSIDQQGGSGGFSSVVAVYGSAMPAVPLPKRAGYTFCGYWTGSDGSGTQYYTFSGDSACVCDKIGSLTLYAVWSSVYTINFHRDDASDEKTAAYDFDYGVQTRLPSLADLGWARRGYVFEGWATSAAEARAGRVWKGDRAVVTSAAPVGGMINLYAVWSIRADSYELEYIRNDGAGTWRTVGFNYGVKARMPSLANGLGWARRGYDFMGWELTTADANDNTRAAPWKGDWAYVAMPIAAGDSLPVYARWALKRGYYQIRFNKNDGTGRWRTLGFQCDTSTKLSTIAALGWERPGYTFVGWASSKANADAGKVWKTDGEWVKNVAVEGRTLSVYAVWDCNWPMEGGPSSVQLWEGGPYWATTNIGAENPEDYGYYFWWGDTVGYKRENDKWVATDGSSSSFSFSSSNIPTYKKSIATLKSEGWITADGVLAPEHDAAHVHWGGDWRMPTDAEISALINNCTTTWTTWNGVYGRFVTGRGAYADRSIFLPAAGCGFYSFRGDSGSEGGSWSSAPNSGNSNHAWNLGFDSSYFHQYDYLRYNGRSVRPVRGFAE